MREAVAKEQEHACSVPRGGGWRPGARWARQGEDVPAHRRPARHEVGRREEPAPPPFRAMPPDEGGAPSRLPLMAQQLPGGTAPLVTSLRDANRIIVGSSCPRAHSLGIVPGMALATARARVRGLDIRPADPEGDLAALHSLAVLAARHWSPIVALGGADGLFLDLTGTAHLFGGEKAMAQRLVRLLARLGYTARIAIADTPGAAWALARFQGDANCPPGAHAAALAPLPIEALRIETKHSELLRRLGVETIGQLAAMPRAPLVRRFGSGLAARLLQALGDLPEPLDPVVPLEAIAVARRFAEPIQTAEAIAHWLGALVPELAAALEAAGLGALRLELVADRIDGVPQRIRLGLARPSRDPLHLMRLLGRRIESIEPGFGIDALALHIRRAGPLGAEPFTERLDEEAPPDLAPLVDTLATRIGLARMWRMRPVESDVPERASARMAVLDPPARAGARLKAEDVRQLDRNPLLAPWHPHWPKPARLLPRPERLDHVMAELPDHAPRRFTWRGRLHKVVCADGPERIHGEWWKRAGEIHYIRDYFRVEDEEGRRYWLFRRGDGERGVTGDLSWYLHGVFG